MSRSAFTLVEVLLAMAIFITIAAVGYMSVTVLLGNTGRQIAIDKLTADIRSQQIVAMLGANLKPQAVYFLVGTPNYTLFECAGQYGCVFDPDHPANLTYTLEGSGRFTQVSLPSAQVVFQPNSGEIQGYNPSTNTITITNTADNAQVTVMFNEYGAMTIL